MLERVQTLGGTFAVFNYATRANASDSSIVVDLPVEQNTAFFACASNEARRVAPFTPYVDEYRRAPIRPL